MHSTLKQFYDNGNKSVQFCEFHKVQLERVSTVLKTDAADSLKPAMLCFEKLMHDYVIRLIHNKFGYNLLAIAIGHIETPYHACYIFSESDCNSFEN